MTLSMRPAPKILVMLTLSGLVVACGGGGSHGGSGAATAPKFWGTPQLLETGNFGDAEFPQIAVDSSGNAIAVWEQFDGLRTNIWANRFTPGGGWGTADLIETNNLGDAHSPQVAFDSAGNAIAVWYQAGAVSDNIWSNRYTAGSGWGTAQLIEFDNTGDASHSQIAADPAGNAIAVWRQNDGTRYNIWANRYTSGSGWGTAQLIETNNLGNAGPPEVATDRAGNAIAVWSQSDGIRSNIWSNRYTFGAGWGTAELIETDNLGSASIPQLAVDAAGNAIAVWFQFDGIRNNIWANQFEPGSGWGTAQLIESNNLGSAFSPEIAIDASGNATAVWYQSDGARTNIWANRYTVGSGWGTAALIETNDLGDAIKAKVAVDASGNATAVWYQSDGTRSNIWTNRYTAGSGWGTAELVETDDAGNASNPQIAIDAFGDAIAVWGQSDGARYNIWASRYQ